MLERKFLTERNRRWYKRFGRMQGHTLQQKMRILLIIDSTGFGALMGLLDLSKQTNEWRG